MEADRLLEHWQDEGDFDFLYQQLAQTDKEPDRKEFFTRMAAIERRHQKVFAELLKEQGIKTPITISLPDSLFRIAIKMITPLLNTKIQRAIKVIPIFLDYLTDKQLFGNSQTCKVIEKNNGPKLPLWNEYLANVFNHYLKA